jgi:hypothetical protein
MKIAFIKKGESSILIKNSLLLKILFVSAILLNTMAYSTQGKDKGCLHNIILEI